MNTMDVLALIQHTVDSGLKSGTALMIDIDPDSEMTLQQGIGIIDAAVKMQKRHAENMALETLRSDNSNRLKEEMAAEGYQSADFPGAGDTIPMTEFQAERLDRYLKRLELPGLHWDDIRRLSYNDAVSRVRAFSEMYSIKGMTPEEVDELYTYMQSNGIHGDQIDCRGKTLIEAKAEVDAFRSIADRTDSAYGTVPGM